MATEVRTTLRRTSSFTEGEQVDPPKIGQMRSRSVSQEPPILDGTSQQRVDQLRETHLAEFPESSQGMPQETGHQAGGGGGSKDISPETGDMRSERLQPEILSDVCEKDPFERRLDELRQTHLKELPKGFFKGENDFQIGVEIGEGSSGKVHILKCKGKHFASKIFYEADKYARRECSIHTSLPPHPNVVTARKVLYLPDNKIALVTDFEAQSKTLEKRALYYRYPISKKPSEDSTKAFVLRIRRLAMDLISGIAHLHEHHIVHKCIKDNNILLFPDPKEGRDEFMAKLIDLGFARDERTQSGWPLEPDEEPDMDLTRPQTPSENYECSPLEASDEAKGIRDGEAYDVGALGFLLHDISTGYGSSSKFTNAEKIELKKHPLRYPSNYPEELKNLINGMTHLDPKERLTITQIKEDPFFRD